MRWSAVSGFGGALAIAWLGLAPARAQDAPAPSGDPTAARSPAILEFHFTPVARSQLAIWIERGGQLLSTVRLTEAVGYRGLGNRPGASQMNSGFRWPYGRREGVLPVWATRRASAPGARQFRRVIFQNRASEGHASRTVADSSADHYYCLSFTRQHSRKDALDAVSCASLFQSDKGRFLAEHDVAAGYAEPYEQPGSGEARMRALALESLYPPRRDVSACGDCLDHPDVAGFKQHAREVMPELDAVTMATPAGDVAQRILYLVPEHWAAGDDYRACLEVNTEGDYNAAFSDSTYPTPLDPAATPLPEWDDYAIDWGYPYRGQPSVAYCADFRVDDAAEPQSVEVVDPAGTVGTWDVGAATFGQLRPMNEMTDDPVGAPGSGADRLQLMDNGYRLKVVVRPPNACASNVAPSAVDELTLARHGDERHAHEWARLRFRAASDDEAIYRYEVRVSTEPIVDDASFMAGVPAKQATAEAAELLVPTVLAAGEPIEVELGGLAAQTHYYVGVRAADACTAVGPVRTAELTTPRRTFATVTPCFVATAAWGTPLAREVGSLRRFRDRHLLAHGPGRALVATYQAIGPWLAELIRPREDLRALARAALAPLVNLARAADRD